MTDTLAALIIERGTLNIDDGKKKSKPIANPQFDSEWPNEGVLQKKFQLDQFQRLMYNGGIVDESGKKGIKYGDISLIFSRAIKNRSTRLEARAAKRKTKVSKGTESKEILGRSDFEILLEELQEVPLVQGMFATPMILTVYFARKAKDVEEKAREAEAKLIKS